MTIKIVGQALVITSSLKRDDIETLAKYNPKALRLVEKQKDSDVEKFRVSVGEGNSISRCGISFGNVTADGLAQCSVLLPNMEADKRADFVKNELGMALYSLSQIETQTAAALTTVKATLDTVMAGVTVE